ncbi:MAG: ATP-binding cassette domain-containing protein [Bacillota bacterium]|nr:ATP-binding cassette domain-containing protein [Bacillota bacterium]
MAEQETMIRLEGIKKRFQTKAGEIEVLHGVDADIKKGEVFGIIGLSGAGKSTLVRCINLLERPTGGKVWLDGVDLMALNEKELREQRRHMGMIFQQFHLLMQKTALENVCFPLLISGVPKAQAKERAKELLELVGLADRMESYPSQLSGGQKQRVAIARALATEPKVLLCDEATSALDPNTTAGVLALLKDINARLGITIVVITHEMSVIQEICDRVAIIDGGLIAEEGTVEEIFRNPKTQIGKELVLHEGENREAYTGRLPHCYRLVFKGGSENEPVLGRMMIDTKGVANILAANTRTIDDQAFGQMVLQFPEEKELRETMIQYLRDRGVVVEEVEYV